MSAKITKEIVKHIAELIKIHIPDSDLDAYRAQLETALEPTEVFSELDTEGIDETSQTVGTSNVFGVDQPRDSLSQEDATMNAKFKENGYFMVKRVVNNK